MNQNITALYEIVLNEKSKITIPIFTIDFRYKLPDSDVSQPIALQVFDEDNSFDQSSDFMKFTASLASFSMLLSDYDHKSSSYDNILEWMDGMKLRDQHGYKKEFRSIVLSTRKIL